jgi:hypothetical protein
MRKDCTFFLINISLRPPLKVRAFLTASLAQLVRASDC